MTAGVQTFYLVVGLRVLLIPCTFSSSALPPSLSPCLLRSCPHHLSLASCVAIIYSIACFLFPLQHHLFHLCSNLFTRLFVFFSLSVASHPTCVYHHLSSLPVVLQYESPYCYLSSLFSFVSSLSSLPEADTHLTAPLSPRAPSLPSSAYAITYALSLPLSTPPPYGFPLSFPPYSHPFHFPLLLTHFLPFPSVHVSSLSPSFVLPPCIINRELFRVDGGRLASRGLYEEDGPPPGSVVASFPELRLVWWPKCSRGRFMVQEDL